MRLNTGLGTGRRWRSSLGTALLWVILVILVAGVALERYPRLLVGESVDAGFEALARATWDQFLALFRARSACFGDVRLEAAYDLGSRAGYDRHTAAVTVRVPGTAAMLQSSLIHEWAHHVEFQCPAHEDLRPAFLAAQGLPFDTPWRPAEAAADVAADEWADIPSEQYAEATIELVLGGRPIPTGAHVTREAVRVIEEWTWGHRPPERPVEIVGE